MTENQTDSIEALLALVDLAQQDIVEAVSSLADQGESAFGDLCREHLETIGWDADMAGLGELNAIANRLQAQLEAMPAMITAEQGAELASWFGDVQLHLGAPQDVDIVRLLLNPLAQELQAEMLEALSQPSGIENHDSQIDRKSVV
jgi:hypothetical protein